MALGNIFSVSCPSDVGSLDNGPLGNAGIFNGGLRPEQEDGLRVAEGCMPIRVEKEGLRQRARRRHKHRLHLPAVKNLSPAGPELYGGLKLAQEVVAIEVRPAVHEYTILGIKFPDGIASPVVVNKDVTGLVAGPQERDSFLRKLLGLAGILVAGESDPLHQCKHTYQNDNRAVEKWPEPRGARRPLRDR